MGTGLNAEKRRIEFTGWKGSKKRRSPCRKAHERVKKGHYLELKRGGTNETLVGLFQPFIQVPAGYTTIRTRRGTFKEQGFH